MIEIVQLRDGALQQASSLDELPENRGDEGLLWVNLRDPEPEELEAALAPLLPVHPLTLEDCLNVSKFPKAEAHAGYSLLIVLSPRTTVPQRAEFYMREIDILLAPGRLVTIHRDDVQAIQRLRDGVSKDGAAFLERGVDFLLHALLDVLVDRYLTAAQVISTRSRELQEQTESQGGGLELLAETLDLRHGSETLRSFIVQTRDVLRRLRRESDAGWLREASACYFQDLDDHLERARRLCDLSTSRLRGTRDLLREVHSERREGLLLALCGLVALAVLGMAASLALPAIEAGPAARLVGAVALALAALAGLGGLWGLRRRGG